MKIIDFGDVRTDFVNGAINRIVQTYLDSLEQKTLFTAKLEDLIIEIIIVDYKSAANCEYDFKTKNLSITFEINPNDSKKFIAFLIAHEFAHILFLNLLDTYCLSGLALDKSRNLSAIRRIMQNDDSYGYYLEELFADYIAHFIVSKLNYDDENDQYKSVRSKSETRFQIISKFESIFGKSILDGTLIDEIYTDDQNWDHYNFLWQSIISFAFNNIINIYDEVMGINAFHSFCDLIDTYCEKGYNEIDNEKEKNEIFGKIDLFASKL